MYSSTNRSFSSKEKTEYPYFKIRLGSRETGYEFELYIVEEYSCV
jgi:hypothetical protein